ncbi:MAG TPA: glycosyltransferase [Tepidisphaeraceae bacterium]|jgi:glycosyltransferase involved in cell wall biosynthesis
MSISVVIPAYNAGQYLDETIWSVRAQSFNDWELIIVDDGSKDDTAFIVERHVVADSRIRLIRQENQGVSHSRNNGLAQSDPVRPMVLFLDADDLLERHAIEILLSALQSHPSAPAAHGRARLIDHTGSPIIDQVSADSVRISPHGNIVPAEVDEPTTSAMLAVMNCIQSTGAVLIYKAALSQLVPQGFDQRIAGAADWDMWFRLARTSPILFCPEIVLFYRVHASSMSRGGKAMRRAGRVMRQNWLSDLPEQRATICSGYAASLRWIARRQLAQMYSDIRCRRGKVPLRQLALTAWCAIKALPGISRLILLVGR